jgi:CheY-like chemotaxis protein/anti-sigma regulatory factor (Ser/Thr protein kinase)
MENIAVVMANQASTQNVNFTLSEIDAVHCDLIGSTVYIRRILVNIISNAIKYNKKNGMVTIYCREGSDDLETGRRTYEFVCADTGIGMSKEFQKHMFKRFTQEKVTDDVTHHGTGLGLSIVKTLVDEMNGSIRCESEVGKGTTFYISLPFIVDTSVNKNVISSNEDDNKSLEGVNVLLVEDNEINMEVSEFILKQEGMNVIKAWNGKEAVEIFKKSHIGGIDIILMDIMMPVMDGETAAREIRDLDRKDAKIVPIIAMTANAFEEDVKTAMESGMNEHLAKPIDPDGIRRAILKYL